MFGTIKLAGVSAVLAAALVLATGARNPHEGLDLRPSLVVVFGESQPEMNAAAATSRTDTLSDIIPK